MTSTPALILAVKERLEAALPDLVTGEELPAVNAYYRYRPAISSPVKAPCVWVAIESAERGTGDLFNTSVKEYAHVRNVLVGVIVGGKDQETVEYQLQTYEDLIRAFLEGDDNGLEDYVCYAEWASTDYASAFDGETAIYREAAQTFVMPAVVLRGSPV